jgi:hypothetical protein
LFDQGGWDIPVFPDPTDITTVRSELIEQGACVGIDIVCRGVSNMIEARERSEGFAALEAVGMTWWLESFGPGEPPVEIVEDVVRRGPAVIT